MLCVKWSYIAMNTLFTHPQKHVYKITIIYIYTQILIHLLLVSFIGSNLLTIKDEAENSFLLEELLAFRSSVQMIWLNAQFDGDSK